MESVLLNAAGHRRSPATMPGFHPGRPARNKGEQYPADPPTVGDRRVMRTVNNRPDGHRLRALIVLLWRAGLRIGEALALQESLREAMVDAVPAIVALLAGDNPAPATADPAHRDRARRRERRGALQLSSCPRWPSRSAARPDRGSTGVRRRHR